jgi:hypothetical protein
MSLWFRRRAAARLAGLGCLSICLLVLTAGCTPRSVEMAEVSGQVLFRGKPLPGGRVTFVSKSGQTFSGSGNIDEKGNYKVEAPVGDVTVSVDNRMLGGAPVKRKGGSGEPAKKPGLKRPGSEAAQTVKGRYVQIPTKYHSPETSGLQYSIHQGSNQIEIKLE